MMFNLLATYYHPPTARGIVDPPLKGYQYLPVGYGDSGTVPYTFFLREGQNVDVGVLKLFLSRKHVDLSGVAQCSPFGAQTRYTAPATVKGLRKEVDLSDVAQPTPLVPIGVRSTVPAKEKGHIVRPRPREFHWGTILVPVVLRRGDR